MVRLRMGRQSFLFANSGIAPIPGMRTHVCCVFTRKQLQLFVDGALVATQSLADKTLTTDSQRFEIGWDLTDVLDEIRVSRVARYTANFTPAKRFERDAESLAVYHCDEGAGKLLLDDSGRGNDAKIIGPKWVQTGGMTTVP